MKFSIRDLFLVTVIVAVCVAGGFVPTKSCRRGNNH